MATYRIVTYREDGTMDIMETFTDRNDARANGHARRLARGTSWEHDWYVLDSHGRNINA